jgi:peptidoglycan/xylan/chitin deacetylase (PgdA/CDA1 family)
MTPRFFITIDTEEDDWGEYRSSGFSLDAVRQLPRVQEIFDAYGAIPTYLVTYPVIKDEWARAFFLDKLAKRGCEIGAHCHPWNTPPFDEEINEHNSMLCNLPYTIVRDKIANLKEEISSAVNVVPVSFRAGRWGFGPNVAAAINELGFRIDTSVTPHVDWATDGGPDYRTAPEHAYRFSSSNILTPAPQSPLLEVPVTIGFLQRHEAFGRRAIAAGSIARRLHIRGILDKARIVNLRWLSPELSTAREMITLAKRCLLRKDAYLNMSFHSTTLIPGRTQFVRTPRDLDLFLRNIDAVIKYVANEGVIFSGLAESLQIA